MPVFLYVVTPFIVIQPLKVRLALRNKLQVVGQVLQFSVLSEIHIGITIGANLKAPKNIIGGLNTTEHDEIRLNDFHGSVESPLLYCKNASF